MIMALQVINPTTAITGLDDWILLRVADIFYTSTLTTFVLSIPILAAMDILFVALR